MFLMLYLTASFSSLTATYIYIFPFMIDTCEPKGAQAHGQETTNLKDGLIEILIIRMLLLLLLLLMLLLLYLYYVNIIIITYVITTIITTKMLLTTVVKLR